MKESEKCIRLIDKTHTVIGVQLRNARRVLSQSDALLRLLNLLTTINFQLEIKEALHIWEILLNREKKCCINSDIIERAETCASVSA